MSLVDVIVVGAGFSGAVIAERFASQVGAKVLVLEQRSHIAGNCFDYRNEHGVLIHKYGPHLFHTNNEAVWSYLSEFTQWTAYEHEVLGSVDGKLVPIPFNLNSLYSLFPEPEAKEVEALLLANYTLGEKVSIWALRQSDSAKLRELGEFVYQKLFVNYTTKQWGCAPEHISPEVLNRVPVVISKDNRYFHDKYQAIPSEGYSQLITKMLNHPNIEVQLNTNASSLISLNAQTKQIYFDGEEFTGKLFFTGMLDQLFNYIDGELPYRSLQFDFETLNQKQFQPVTTVNYPNEHAFTRITEFKHILKDKSEKTTIVREFPQDYDRNDPNKNVPYYPLFTDANERKYEGYHKLAKQFPQLKILGRLGDYKYYNMDDAIAKALFLFDLESSE